MNKDFEQIEARIDKLLDEDANIEILLKQVSKLNLATDKEQLLKKISEKTKFTIGALKTDLKRIEALNKLNIEKPQKSDSNQEEFTEKEKEQAIKLLYSPNILEQMVDITERAGYVGEILNKIILILACISRLFNKAISIIIKAPSSAGKSALVALILQFVPKEYVLVTSMLTPKGLFHYLGNLSHKVLYVHEYEGSRGADFPLRISLSESELVWMGTIKDEKTGNFNTETKTVPAEGLVLIQTTTSTSIHPENETRCFTLVMDDSKEQTRKVLDIQAETAEGVIGNIDEMEKEFRTWRCALTVLEPFEVTIPFASKLAKVIPIEDIRARRDFPRVLLLIKAHALLYQKQRKQINNKIVAQGSDLYAVAPLIAEVFKPSLGELSKNEIKILEIIKDSFDLSAEKEYSLKELHEKVKNMVSYSTLKNYLHTYLKNGLMEWNRKSGAGSCYKLSRLANNPLFDTNLLESLKNLASELAKDEQADFSQLANCDQEEHEIEIGKNRLALAKAGLANSCDNYCHDNSTLCHEIECWSIG
ncbi:MAG: hypothetical protein ACREOW_10280 [Thermodesulfobacteriota bacterium]